MSKEKRLIKNTLIFTIGNFSTKLLTFLLLPFYTYYLSTEDYGFVDVVSTTISFFIPIITFQLMDGCYRYLITAEDDTKKSRIISNSIIVVLRNLLIADLIYIIVNLFINLRYSTLILIQFNMAVISSFLQQSIRGLKKNHVYAIAGIISTFCMLTSNIVLVVFVGLKAEALIISTIISSISIIIYIFIITKYYKYIDFKTKSTDIANQLVKYSIPLIPNSLNWWVMNVSDRLIINIFLGVSSNGIYAIANKFPQLVQMICNMFNMAWQESAIIEYDSKSRDEFYSNTFDNYSTIVLSAMIVMLSVTRILFTIGINEKFAEAYNYVPFLYFGAVFSTFSSFFGTGYQSSKNTKGAFSSSILGSVINIIVNLLLVPFIGLYAASISTMLSFLFMWLYRIFDTKKYFTIKIKWNKFGSLLIVSFIYILLYYINTNLIILSAGMLIAFIIFIVANKAAVERIYLKIRRKVVY